MKILKNISNYRLNKETLFCFLLDIYLLFSIFGMSMYAYIICGVPQKVMSIIVMISMALLEIKNGYIQLRSKDCAVLFVTLFLFCISYMRNPIEISIGYLIIYFARNQKFYTITKHAYYVSILSLIFIVLSSQCGIIEDIIYEGYRHAVGFRYVLYGPSLFLNTVMMKVYLKKENLNWSTILLICIANSWLWIECNANLSCGLTFLLIIYMIYYKNSLRRNYKNNLYISSFSFLICIVLSYMTLYFYSQNVSGWIAIDRWLSGRLQLSIIALVEYPPTLFGNSVEWVGNGVDILGNVYEGDYYYVDNAYINYFIEFGIIASLIIWSIYTLVIYKCAKLGDNILVVCLTLLAIYFLFDNLKLKLVYNILILLTPVAFSINNIRTYKDSKERNG